VEWGGAAGLYSKLRAPSWSLGLALVDILMLKPHEETMPKRVDDLVSDLRSRRILEYPVVVDHVTLTILDGHHRVEALARLGYRFAPALLVDYLSSRVKVEPRRNMPLSKIEVIARAAARRPYPPKTTRHVLPGPPPRIALPLRVMERWRRSW